MPKIALYVSAIAFGSVAVIFGLLAVFEVDVLVGQYLLSPDFPNCPRSILGSLGRVDDYCEPRSSKGLIAKIQKTQGIA